MVTVNAKLLGGTISVFQSVCVIGYCVFPLVLGSIFCNFVRHSVYRAIVLIIALLWASRASVLFMAHIVPMQRRLLAVYPLTLFYAVIAWLIFAQ